MPRRPALRPAAKRARRMVVLALAVAAAGCTQPGTQAPKPEAARLFHATGDISLACGYAQELLAFGGPHPAGLGTQDTMAVFGVRLLLNVWSRNRTWTYQGETINQVVSDSSSLLGSCGLTNAQHLLQHAIEHAG